MPLKIRASKFRHVFGQPTRKESCFENIRVTKNAHDSNFCAVNPKFIAVVLESVGGGAFVVLQLKQIGRVDVEAPKICGHAGPITDIKWNPFDDYVIASSSDDLTIKVWEIPEHGLHSNVTRCLSELKGHTRRVTYIEWHPAAENIMLSCAFDYRCIVWNVLLALPLNVISCHSSTIYSISWNYNGSLFATTCKDKKLRVINPRSGRVLQEGESHYGLKTCKVVFLNNNRLFTTGFSKTGDREFALWDASDLSAPLHQDTIDYTSGVLLPFYDSDLDIVYLAGKGDGNIRYYEVADDTVTFLNQYPSSDPQRGMGFMPKRGLDVSKCEIAKFFKLHTNKQLVEPLPMIVPRRSDEFQEDIYPPTASINPALSADEWASGMECDPIKESMQDRADRAGSSEPSRLGTLRQQARNQMRTQVVKPVQNVLPPPPKNAPASVQNIYKLSTDQSKVVIPDVQVDKSPAKTISVLQNGSSKEDSPLPSTQVSVRREHSQTPATTSHQQSFHQQSPSKQARPGQQTKASAHVRPSHLIYQESQNQEPKQSPAKEFVPVTRALYSSDGEENTEHHETKDDTSYHGHHSSHKARDSGDQQQSAQQLKWRHNAAWQKAAAPVGSPVEQTASRLPGISSHNRQVSAPVVPQVQCKSAVNGSQSTLTNDELHKTYFKQCDEIKQLRQMLAVKDKRIETLEQELGQLKKIIISH